MQRVVAKRRRITYPILCRFEAPPLRLALLWMKRGEG